MAAQKQVTITIKSICNTGDGSPDVIELITSGKMRKVDKEGFSGWQLSYDDSESTGFAESSTVVTCFGNTLASLDRLGSCESHLILEPENKHHCHYGTEYGSMLMGIYTHRIINRLDENGGELYFKYTIDINSAFISDNEFYMNVELK